jgi:hypothetical protein
VVLGESGFSYSQRVSLPLIQNLSPAIFIDLSQKMNVWKCTNGCETSGNRGFSYAFCFFLRESWLFNSDVELVSWKQKTLFSYYLKECLLSWNWPCSKVSVVILHYCFLVWTIVSLVACQSHVGKSSPFTSMLYTNKEKHRVHSVYCCKYWFHTK